MYNPRVIVLILLTGIALLFVANGDTTPEPDVTTYSSSAWVNYTITEESPDWDCATMGNRECGTVTQTFEDGSTRESCDKDLALYEREDGSLFCALDVLYT